MGKIHDKANIILLFRKPNPRAFSIEEIFKNLFIHFCDFDSVFYTISCEHLPYSGNGILNKIKNILFVVKKKSELIHVTGEIYYVVLFKRNTIITIHDIALAINGNWLKKNIIGLIWYKIPARLCKKITVISNSSKQEFLKYTGINEEKIHVIPNPINPNIKHKPLPKNKTKKILVIGTKENKNLNRLFKASTNLDIHVHIIGKLKEHQIKSLIEHKIIYTNDYNLTFDEIINHYHQSDIVAFISTYEGFGMPIIEAQAAGRPVLTSNCSSMPEVGGEGALYINPFDISDIRNGLEKLINDEELVQDIIQKGLKNVKRFQPNKIASQYHELYEDILNAE